MPKHPDVLDDNPPDFNDPSGPNKRYYGSRFEHEEALELEYQHSLDENQTIWGEDWIILDKRWVLNIWEVISTHRSMLGSFIIWVNQHLHPKK